MTVCGQCGDSASIGSRFCNKCGNELTGPRVGKLTGPAPMKVPMAQDGDSCRYHPEATVVGRGVDCQSGFCGECAVEIVRHGSVCLDCGVRFARKKVIQAYIAAALGFLVGLLIASQAASQKDWLLAITAPAIYAYFFPATFFGWHYGGKIWKVLSSVSDHFSGVAGLGVAIFVLTLRLIAAVFLRVFGGGIMQYLNYRRLIGQQDELSGPTLVQGDLAGTSR